MAKHKLTLEDRKKGAFTAENAVEMAKRAEIARKENKLKRKVFAEVMKEWLDDKAYSKGEPIIDKKDGHHKTNREILAGVTQVKALKGDMQALKMILECAEEMPNKNQPTNINIGMIDPTKPIRLIAPEE